MFGRAVVPSCRPVVVPSRRRASRRPEPWVVSFAEVAAVSSRRRMHHVWSCRRAVLVVPSCPRASRRPEPWVVSFAGVAAVSSGRRKHHIWSGRRVVPSSCEPKAPEPGPRQRRSRSCEQKAALSTICHLPCQRQYHCAERSLRRMRSSIQCASHHSTGFTI